MWRNRLAIFSILLFTATTSCVGSSSTPEVQVSTSTQSVPSLTLKLPDGLHPSLYVQVRKIEHLGRLLDKDLVPGLQAGGKPNEMVLNFLSARSRGIKILSERAGSVDKEASMATGPGPGATPVGKAFDRVCTDVLRAWFITVSEKIAKEDTSLSIRTARLRFLEALAITSFTWDEEAGSSVSIRVMLVRKGLEQL